MTSPGSGSRMKEKNADLCSLCGGTKKPGTTTFTAELGFGVVVIRHVPATVSTQCGADWIADGAAARIEKAVEEARNKHSQVEVLVYS